MSTDLSGVPIEELQAEVGKRLCKHRPDVHVDLSDLPGPPAVISCKCGQYTWAQTGMPIGQLGIETRLEIDLKHRSFALFRAGQERPELVDIVPDEKGMFTIEEIYGRIGVELPEIR